MLTVGNLRGIRESGSIFAVPTYFFVVSICAAARRRACTATSPAASCRSTRRCRRTPDTQPLTTFLLLTAFANGCTAMTGVEAVSNGVPAFRPPEAKNASATLVDDGDAGDRDVRRHHGAGARLPGGAEQPPSRASRSWAARSSAGRTSSTTCCRPATTLILVLAANTAYADFPRLASIVSRDRYLPRQFMNQGDRLAFSNGILVLSVFAAILIVAFRGDTQSLLPLYMIGVFISFTLSQAGMVIHWRQDAASRAGRPARSINGFGAVVTGIVLIIVAVTKTLEGAWIVLLLIPMIVDAVQGDAPALRSRRVAADADAATSRSARVHNTVLIPIGGLQRAVVEALRYAETLSDDVRAVYVDVDPAQTEQLQQRLGDLGRTRAAGRAAVAVPIADGAAARVHRAGRDRAGRTTT